MSWQFILAKQVIKEGQKAASLASSWTGLRATSAEWKALCDYFSARTQISLGCDLWEKRDTNTCKQSTLNACLALTTVNTCWGSIIYFCPPPELWSGRTRRFTVSSVDRIFTFFPNVFFLAHIYMGGIILSRGQTDGRLSARCYPFSNLLVRLIMPFQNHEYG